MLVLTLPHLGGNTEFELRIGIGKWRSWPLRLDSCNYIQLLPIQQENTPPFLNVRTKTYNCGEGTESARL